MISNDFFYSLVTKLGTDFFTGVPDSVLKYFCLFIEDRSDDIRHITAANEGNAIGLAIGHYLGSRGIPIVYMQNSGLGNSVNPLVSLATSDVYSIPMILLIGWRGMPGKKDEPQHVAQGRITKDMLTMLNVPFEILSPQMDHNAVQEVVTKIYDLAKIDSRPCALLVEPGTFEPFSRPSTGENDSILTREDALSLVLSKLRGDELLVSTTGVLSRELYEYRERSSSGHHRDFLTVGGMGHANQIALGIALSCEQRTIVCLDGDGAMLMHMGSLGLIASVNPLNFKHIVFNNHVHDSVGGQTTSHAGARFAEIAASIGYARTQCVSERFEIESAIKELRDCDDLSFLEIEVRAGFRVDLSRPTTTPLQNKESFIGFIDA